MKFGLPSCLATLIVSSALLGCAEEPVTPPPAPPGNDAPDTPETRPEAALEEGGADAALPPDQRPQAN